MRTPTITGNNILHTGKFLQLRQLEMLRPDGSKWVYEVATRNSDKVFGIVTILAITRDDEFILNRQYRAPLDRVGIELAAGCAEVGKHATLEDAVDAELLEETGYGSRYISRITEFSSSSGMTNETVHGYVARNCERVTDILDLDESEHIEQVIVPCSQFDQFILSEIARGAIIEPKMLAMVYMWRQGMIGRSQ
jgi:ADP-ribose pyrophosphatase